MRMNPTLFAALLLCLAFTAAAEDNGGVTLKQIMDHPDWLGTPPKEAFWSEDGRAVYFKKKVIGEEHDALWVLPLDDGEPRVVEPAERAGHGVDGGDYNDARTLKAFTRAGELYLQTVPDGLVTQLTRSGLGLQDARFIAGDRIAVRGDGFKFYAWDLETSRLELIADVRTEDDPTEGNGETSHLVEQQMRLISVLRDRAEREEQREQRGIHEIDNDPGRPPRPWYLGADTELHHASLSPNGRHLLVATAPANRDRGRSDTVPHFVTDEVYVDNREVRAKVGTVEPFGHTLAMLDLETGVRLDLDISVLPGIDRDPLRRMRADAGLDPLEGDRPVLVMDSEWNDAGDRLAVMFRSFDNKDRWIATLQTTGFEFQPRHRLSDEAWINWYTSRDYTWFNDFGWLPDGENLWYLSEESGYSHLYIKPDNRRRARQLTSGEWEVSRPNVTRDGAYIYFTANREHPGMHEVYRVGVGDGTIERLTRRGGSTFYALSPDERRLLLTSSSMTRHNELFVQDADTGAEAVQLTETMSGDYLAYDWIEPEIVAIPSSHVRGADIHTRVYTPPDFDPDRAEPYPAVMFAHGAGYLQNVVYGWSGYFREYMFHHYLAERGYVVFDMDFRASAGYGRDWRTAIYRQMGTPELEDFTDGVRWMAEHRNVDPERVGIYGGSYGGFLAFMALFREPGLFAAGAALRPVSDWMHYQHYYTANILNTPQIDPEAYLESSPIEFAEGLDAPLLILAPMVDMNVLFKDVVRLVQRLIELEKTEHFETAIYPVEDHAFIEPSSWLDEYRRIFMLFDEHLK